MKPEIEVVGRGCFQIKIDESIYVMDGEFISFNDGFDGIWLMPESVHKVNADDKDHKFVNDKEIKKRLLELVIEFAKNENIPISLD